MQGWRWDVFLSIIIGLVAIAVTIWFGFWGAGSRLEAQLELLRKEARVDAVVNGYAIAAVVDKASRGELTLNLDTYLEELMAARRKIAAIEE